MPDNKGKKVDIDRLSVWVVGVIGFFVIAGGIFQMRWHIFAPDRMFAASRARIAAYEERKANEEVDPFTGTLEGEEMAKLQTQDTDEDGLSDFDELYIYATSPYLSDSDSDGVVDSREITDGTDPNCPAGSACAQERTGGYGSEATAAEQAYADLNPDSTLGSTDTSEDVDMNELRSTLLQYGVPQDVLDQTDDATLQQIFDETMTEVDQGSNAFANVQAEAENIRNMSIDEKKQWLLESGMDEASINALDDDTINDIFNEAIDQAMEQLLLQDDIENAEFEYDEEAAQEIISGSSESGSSSGSASGSSKESSGETDEE